MLFKINYMTLKDQNWQGTCSRKFGRTPYKGNVTIYVIKAHFIFPTFCTWPCCIWTPYFWLTELRTPVEVLCTIPARDGSINTSTRVCTAGCGSQDQATRYRAITSCPSQPHSSQETPLGSGMVPSSKMSSDSLTAGERRSLGNYTPLPLSQISILLLLRFCEAASAFVIFPFLNEARSVLTILH